MFPNNVTYETKPVAIISRQPDSYSVQRFTEAASLRGINLVLLDPHLVYVDLLNGVASAYVAGRELDFSKAALVPRLGSTATEYSLVVLDMLERVGARSVNSYASIMRLRNKFTAVAQLASAGVPAPDTAMLRTPCDIAPAVQRLGGYPLVLKFIRGSQGVGVVLAPDESVVISVLEALNLLQYDVLLQRYYPQAARTDLRVFVLGGEARWAVRRTSSNGRFRSNFHRGGTAQQERLGKAVAQLAEQAARVFELDLAGVDLIEGPEGLLVMEVNSSPGFETIEQTHSADVAGVILEFALSKL
jgi:ribosomal protein S6--L-glutamate ligase